MPKEATLTINVDNSKAKASRDEFLGMMTKMANQSLRQMKTLSKAFDDMGDSIPAKKLAALRTSVNAGITRFEKMKEAVSTTRKSSLSLTAALGKLTGGLKLAGGGLDNVGGKAKKTENKINKLASSLKGHLWASLKKATSGMLNFAKAMVGLSVAAGFHAIIEAGKTLEKLEVSLFSVTGSTAAAASELENMFEMALDFGVSMDSISKSMIKLSAAAIDTDLGLAGATATMKAMLVTSRALGLTSEDTKGAIYALQQMVSKSTVSMEELKLQLGERIPGALNTAAAAMGMGVGQFKKLVEAGGLASDVFIRLFNIELVTKYFEGASKGSTTLQAKLDRLKTTMLQIFSEMASSGLFDVFKGLIDEFTDTMVSNKDLLTGLANQIAGVFDRILMSIQLAGKDDIRNFFMDVVNSVAQLVQLMETIRQITMKIAAYMNIDVPAPDLSKLAPLDRLMINLDHIAEIKDMGEISIGTAAAERGIADLKGQLENLKAEQAAITAKPVRSTAAKDLSSRLGTALSMSSTSAEGIKAAEAAYAAYDKERAKGDDRSKEEQANLKEIAASIQIVKSNLAGVIRVRNAYMEQGRQIGLLENSIETQTVSAIQGIDIELKKIDINEALNFSESKTLGARLSESRDSVAALSDALQIARGSMADIDLSGLEAAGNPDEIKSASKDLLSTLPSPGSDPEQLKAYKAVLQELAAYGIAVKANSILEKEAAEKTKAHTDRLDKMAESLKTTSDSTELMWAEERRLNAEIAGLNKQMITADGILSKAKGAGLANAEVTRKHAEVTRSLTASIKELTDQQELLAGGRLAATDIGFTEESFDILNKTLEKYKAITTQLEVVGGYISAGGPNMEAYTSAWFDLRTELAAYNKEMGEASFTDGFVLGIESMLESARNFSVEAGELFAGTFEDLSNAMGTAIADSILLGESFTETFQEIGQSVARQFITTLVQMGVQLLVSKTLSAAFGAEMKGQKPEAQIKNIALVTAATIAAQTTVTAGAVTSAASIASAMAPAAASASLATLGTNAIGAAAGISAVHALSQSLSGSKKIGGSVEADNMYRVGEGINPEIFRADNGTQFFIPPERGKVVPVDSVAQTPSKAAPSTTEPESAAPPAPPIVNVIIDPNDMVSVIGSNAGVSEVLTIMETNADQIKAKLRI